MQRTLNKQFARATAFLFATVLATWPQFSMGDVHSDKQNSESRALDLGQKLRLALNKRVDLTRSHHENLFRENISTLVSQFFPAGTTMQQAYAILQNAGMSVSFESPKGFPPHTPIPALIAERTYQAGWGTTYSTHIAIFASSEGKQGQAVDRVEGLLRTNAF